jgi:hypothetical protein
MPANQYLVVLTIADSVFLFGIILLLFKVYQSRPNLRHSIQFIYAGGFPRLFALCPCGIFVDDLLLRVLLVNCGTDPGTLLGHCPPPEACPIWAH